jgi:hypothetical protein
MSMDIRNIIEDIEQHEEPLRVDTECESHVRATSSQVIPAIVVSGAVNLYSSPPTMQVE